MFYSKKVVNNILGRKIQKCNGKNQEQAAWNYKNHFINIKKENISNDEYNLNLLIDGKYITSKKMTNKLYNINANKKLNELKQIAENIIDNK